MTKYIFFTYGIIGGYQKGIIASSTALLLRSLGLKVTAARIDPFLQLDGENLDPGYAFLLNDGVAIEELGNYERFLNTELTKAQYITSGQVFNKLVEKERAGGFLGRSVTLVGDGTDKMQELIERASLGADVCIFELGAEIDLADAQTWLEAIDEFQAKVGIENVAFIHVVPLLALPNSNDATITKPAYDSHRSLITNGTTPDLIACLCSGSLDAEIREKICFEPTKVIPVHQVPTSYHFPLILERENVLEFLSRRLGLDKIDIPPENLVKGKELMRNWKKLVSEYDNSSKTVTIALVGKFANQQDLHNSIVQALEHASVACRRILILKWIEAAYLEQTMERANPEKYSEAWDNIMSASGIIIPNGFRRRGIEGMIAAAKSARERRIPLLAISLGFQAAVIEFARNVCGLAGADSEEIDQDTPHKIIVKNEKVLGIHNTIFHDVSESWSKIRRLYETANVAQVDTKIVVERHNHCYEVNTEYIQRMEDKGLTFVGRNENGNRVEIFELKDHPFFVGTQYHPEYLSRPLNPAPAFLGFILASAGLTIEWLLEKNTVRPLYNHTVGTGQFA